VTLFEKESARDKENEDAVAKRIVLLVEEELQVPTSILVARKLPQGGVFTDATNWIDAHLIPRRGDAMPLIMYTGREAQRVVEVDKVRANKQTGLEGKKACSISLSFGSEKGGENSASLFHAYFSSVLRVFSFSPSPLPLLSSTLRVVIGLLCSWSTDRGGGRRRDTTGPSAQSS
jgi:hypothetical protein